MSRTPVTVRPALPVDAAELRELWGDVLRRGSEEDQVADVERVIARAAEHDDHLVAVAEYDGQVAGAVHLHVSALSALNLEPTVYALSPHVFPRFRRHGVGTALMEAAVRFAEEQGVGHVASAANADWRDANRFLARLSLAPLAVLRVSPTHAVRARLSTVRQRGARGLGRPTSIDRVLAARRVRRADRVAG